MCQLSNSETFALCHFLAARRHDGARLPVGRTSGSQAIAGRPGGCRPRIVNSENLQSVNFQRLFGSELRRFKAEIGNFVTKRRSGRGFWPASCVWGCPGRQDAAERWLKCGTLDVCDASEIFTNIELHPPRSGGVDLFLPNSLFLLPISPSSGIRRFVRGPSRHAGRSDRINDGEDTPFNAPARPFHALVDQDFVGGRRRNRSR